MWHANAVGCKRAAVQPRIFRSRSGGWVLRGHNRHHAGLGVGGFSDGGGKVNASSIPVVGKSKVAKFIFAVRHKGGRKLYYAARMNNTDAIIIYADGKPYAAQFFEFAHGKITRTLIVRNPVKLTLFAGREKLLNQGVLQPVAKFLGAKTTLIIAANSLKRFLFLRNASSALR